ncbi:platelet glycoprotein Ib beta chain [Hemicordylus capensis]|uniref:platelet glycoprotein Ib beta chain n=1 Tax=Hemicordylus capensis TaxID=884348 RepID=UPI002304908F|nr:platelet glycoprotein Ib beta chain [Hemicordylus capensis]
MCQLFHTSFSHSPPAADASCSRGKLTPNGWKMRLLWGSLFLSLLPLVTPSCPPHCQCAQSIINCMATELTDDTMPTSFRPSTTILYLNSNYLTFIPNGLFDDLKSLQMVHLRQNPWHCDCNILYLRAWLQWQQNRTLYRDVVCSSPSHLQGRIISYLSEDEIVTTCPFWYCGVAFMVQISLFVFIFVQAILLGFIIAHLCRFHTIVKHVRRRTAELYENAELWAPAS